MQDDLTNKEWIGVIENNDDPLFLGRCKIRVYGKFDGRIDPLDPNSDFIIPTDKLPWAIPGTINGGGNQSGGGSFSIPKKGSKVKVTFDHGNIYTPIYHYSIYPSNDIIQELQDSYKNAHILLYDTMFDEDEEREGEHIKVFFTEEQGLMMDYATPNGSSIINIRPDNTIYIEYPNGKVIHIQKDKISLGKENESDEPAVLGNKNEIALNDLADQINSLSVSISNYATAQSAIVGSVFPLAPLAPALTALLGEQVPIQTKINGPIKKNSIPRTKSDSISLDGPSKI